MKEIENGVITVLEKKITLGMPYSEFKDLFSDNLTALSDKTTAIIKDISIFGLYADMYASFDSFEKLTRLRFQPNWDHYRRNNRFLSTAGRQEVFNTFKSDVETYLDLSLNEKYTQNYFGRVYRFKTCTLSESTNFETSYAIVFKLN